MRFVTIIGEGVHAGIPYDDTTTFGDLKAEIQSTKNIDCSNFDLKFGNNVLNDNDKLINCYGVGGRFFHLVLQDRNKGMSEQSLLLKGFGKFNTFNLKNK